MGWIVIQPICKLNDCFMLKDAQFFGEINAANRVKVIYLLSIGNFNLFLLGVACKLRIYQQLIQQVYDLSPVYFLQQSFNFDNVSTYYNGY